MLARLRFGVIPAPPSDPRQVGIALAQVGATPMCEVWRSRLPVQHGWADEVGYAHNGEVLFGHLCMAAADSTDLTAAATRAYLRIERLQRWLGYPCRLRMWNFLPHIHRGEGDAERYRQFNRGRHDALARKSGFEGVLPAATAIGTHDGSIAVCFLAARTPGEQVENPRQVSAFHYPASYGPRSPSFSRAMLKHWPDGMHLFVSGTASIVGHRSLHPGDPLAQLDETFRNLRTLLQQAAARQPAAGAFGAAALRIYVRHAVLQEVLKKRVTELFGVDVPLLWLCGDICRRDLLLEIEGLFTAAPLRTYRPEQA
ncbi:hypothetical protein [Panacagrimonas sp.]|uniref:chorismate transformation enzyme, FkbO/Hyg5 family n=1 Tax=Panacagrimonas sp. TaxID=2480088 RepID=UPI003B517389